MAAVSYRSSTYGLLYYDPVSQQHQTDKSQRLFRPRRVGPGRICIKSVDPRRDPPERVITFAFPLYKEPQSQSRPYSVKLALSRENAKRFLRSVIAPPSNTNPSSTEANDPNSISNKRRSWAPTNRSQSQQSGESGAAAEAAAGAANNMRSSNRHSMISGPLNAHLQRPRLNSELGGSSRSSSIHSTANGSSLRPDTVPLEASVIPNLNLEDGKPIVSGNGVSVSIHMAEPVLFLQGFENPDHAPGNTAMLRGALHIRVQKPAKIKTVSLKFKGTAVTKWPEGIPPRKTEFEEKDTIMAHTWPFFNAQFEGAEKGSGADHVHLFGQDGSSSRLDALGRSSNHGSSANLSAKEAKKLALSVNQSRSFGKGETQPGSSVASKGYRTFLPGDYVYNFEYALDSRLPESIDVELGSVKYELEAIVERSGAFRANLVGGKEVTLIRAPGESSLEQVEPIAISRNWEDQLHYDIVISGKSFPLGSQVPIAFKLTPLAKVQCHRIKVLVTENIEYFCSNKKVHRMEPTRKVQLFEKRADQPPQSTFPGSTMRVTSGGGVPYDQRAQAARGDPYTADDSSNLLGNLTGEATIGPTEMEFNVQLPSCQEMKEERARSHRLHFDTTYQNIQVHHWIKIVMRLSKPDATDETKRRHFEISIDSPFHILSCRATQANISLPAYTSPEATPQGASLYECGCPGAALRRKSPPGIVPTLASFGSAASSAASSGTSTPNVPSPGLARPPTIHAADHINRGVHQQQERERPIHLLRAPSFNPPPWSEQEPPPPLITPPPEYDTIASPTSGMADYFARLGHEYDDGDSSGDDTRPGRVNVPLTPGGRVNRSMDLGRNAWIPVGRN